MTGAAVFGGNHAIDMMGLGHHKEVAAALGVPSVDDALADELWQTGVDGIGIVDYHVYLGVAGQEVGSLFLHGVELESGLGDGSVVEVDAVGIGHECHGLDAILGAEGLVERLDFVPCGIAVGGYLVLLHHIGVVHATVVGGEEEEVVALAHLLVEIGEEVGQLGIGTHIGSLILGATGAIGMADDVGRRDADGEHVGDIVLTQLLIVEHGFGHLESLGDTLGAALDVGTRLHTHGLVEAVDPLGQLVHIIGAGDEVSCRGVPPVGGIGSMACGQDGCAVLERNAKDLGLVVGGYLEHIADTCGKEVARRHLALSARRAHAMHGGVGHAVHLLAGNHKIVAGDAVEAWHRAGIDT